jgi:hypothetical protein
MDDEDAEIDRKLNQNLVATKLIDDADEIDATGARIIIPPHTLVEEPYFSFAKAKHLAKATPSSVMRVTHTPNVNINIINNNNNSNNNFNNDNFSTGNLSSSVPVRVVGPLGMRTYRKPDTNQIVSAQPVLSANVSTNNLNTTNNIPKGLASPQTKPTLTAVSSLTSLTLSPAANSSAALLASSSTATTNRIAAAALLATNTANKK